MVDVIGPYVPAAKTAVFPLPQEFRVDCMVDGLAPAAMGQELPLMICTEPSFMVAPLSVVVRFPPSTSPGQASALTPEARGIAPPEHAVPGIGSAWVAIAA